MQSAVDTNVLVRFLVHDGSEQALAAGRIFAAGHVLVPLSVILESEWILRSNFDFGRSAICDAFERVIGLESVFVQEASTVEKAIESCRAGMDFADALHLHSAADCEAFYTFDKKFIRKAEQATRLPAVRHP